MNPRSCLAIVAVLTALASFAAQAAPIDITVGPPGAFLPQRASATVLTFEGLSVGSLPSYLFDSGSLSGSSAIEDTSLVGAYARPAADTTKYLTVSYPSAQGSVHLVFSIPKSYFGLYWGSIDPYNSITFLDHQNQIATFSGTVVADLTGLVANGDQQSSSANRYINFDFGANSYDEVILSTTGFGLEVDNIAFDDATLIVEPSTLILLGSSLCGIALVRRRNVV